MSPFRIDPVYPPLEKQRGILIIRTPLAEAGGFEPPVRLPVRQFSKLVVSATHPHFLKNAMQRYVYISELTKLLPSLLRKKDTTFIPDSDIQLFNII